jgi:hypothetical protein
MEAQKGILCRRRDARCRFSSVLSCGLPELMYAIYGILCRYRDVRRLFVSIVSYGVSSFSWFDLKFDVVAIVGGQFARVVSYGIPKLIFAMYEIFRCWEDRSRYDRRRFAGVLPCGIHSLICSMDGVSCVGVATPIVAALVLGLQVSCMSSRWSGIVEYHRKNIPTPVIFAATRTQDSFRVCDLSFCNLLAEIILFFSPSYSA